MLINGLFAIFGIVVAVLAIVILELALFISTIDFLLFGVLRLGSASGGQTYPHVMAEAEDLYAEELPTTMCVDK